MAIIFGNSNGGAGGGGGSTVTTDNGISGDGSSGNPVVLGGTLVVDTTLVLGGFTLAFTDDNLDCNLGVSGNHGQVTFSVGNDNNADTGTLQLLGLGEASISAVDDSGDQVIALASVGRGATITDDIYSRGWVNADDYSADTTPLRLVQLNELPGPGGVSVVYSRYTTNINGGINDLTDYTNSTGNAQLYRIQAYAGTTGTGTLVITAQNGSGGIASAMNEAVSGGGEFFGSPVCMYVAAGAVIHVVANATGTVDASIAYSIELVPNPIG